MKVLETKKTLTDYFDKIFLLTMANRKERKESVLRQFKEIGIYDEIINSGKFEIVETVTLPITQKALNCMGTSGDISFIYNNNDQRIGQFMCASEHYKMIKRSLINGYERILILEDDVCFIKKFEYIMKALEEAPESFNILHLEGYYWPYDDSEEQAYSTLLTQNIEDGRWISSDEGLRLWCTAALIYSRHGMEEYCRVQEAKFQSPDHPTFWMGNSYSYSYPLIMQEKKTVFTSDIINYSSDIEEVNVYLKYYDYNNYYHFFKQDEK
jgi:GR25 family glycosyltransferase involved in LPS biosynthesis